MKNKLFKIGIPTLCATAVVAPILGVTLTSNSIVNNTNDNATYYTITYNTDDNVTLTGVTKAKIRAGRVFGSVQKPTATHSEGYEFLGWSTVAKDKTKIITDETEVTSALSLYPVFDYQVTISFGQPTGITVTYEGQTTSKVTTGSTFGSINRPTPTATNKYFDGWYTDASCSTPITSTTQLNSDMTIYPKMVSNDWKDLTWTAGENTTWHSLSTHKYNENMIFISAVDVKCSTTVTGNWTVATITIPTGYSKLSDQTSFIWCTLDGTVQGVGFISGTSLIVYTGSVTLAANTAIRFEVMIPIQKS